MCLFLCRGSFRLGLNEHTSRVFYVHSVSIYRHPHDLFRNQTSRYMGSSIKAEAEASVDGALTIAIAILRVSGCLGPSQIPTGIVGTGSWPNLS